MKQDGARTLDSIQGLLVERNPAFVAGDDGNDSDARVLGDNIDRAYRRGLSTRNYFQTWGMGIAHSTLPRAEVLLHPATLVENGRGLLWVGVSLGAVILATSSSSSGLPNSQDYQRIARTFARDNAEHALLPQAHTMST